MKKMRGIVALCVALTMGLGSSALLAQKDDNKKPEVKAQPRRSKSISTRWSPSSMPSLRVAWPHRQTLR